MNPPDPLARPLVWLIAGGAPRSGTTALGTALNQSKQIALFHEYRSYQFFSALDDFFREEDRMRNFADFSPDNYPFPVRERQAQDVALGVFRSVFPGKTPRFIGTKSPSYELLAQPRYPQGMITKTIHITRNPYDVILSSFKKGQRSQFTLDKATRVEFSNHLDRWRSAWNHAVAHTGDENFLHVFYDDLISDPDGERQRVAAFLDGVSDFSFYSFRETQATSAPERFKQAGLGDLLPLMADLPPAENWIESAKRDFQEGRVHKLSLRTRLRLKKKRLLFLIASHIVAKLHP